MRPAGTSGEILYRSPLLCTGYWDKPEETTEAFRNGWFHSGDMVRRDGQGYVFVVDRIKDVINTGGVLVASREVRPDFLVRSWVPAAPDVGTAAIQELAALGPTFFPQQRNRAGNVVPLS